MTALDNLLARAGPNNLCLDCILSVRRVVAMCRLGLAGLRAVYADRERELELALESRMGTVQTCSNI